MGKLKILNMDLTAPDQSFSLVRSKRKREQQQIEKISYALENEDIQVILLHGEECYRKGEMLASKLGYKFYGDKSEEGAVLLQGDTNCGGWFSIPDIGYRIVLPVTNNDNCTEYLTLFSTSLYNRDDVDSLKRVYKDSKSSFDACYTKHHLLGANFFERFELESFCDLNDMYFIDSNRNENRDGYSFCSGLLVPRDVEVESVCRYPILTDSKVLQRTPVSAVVKIK